MGLNLKPVYALIGDDEASIHLRVRALKDAFTSIHGDLTIETYDAGTTPPEEVLMSLMSTSLLAGERIVLVRAFEKWGAAKKGEDTAIAAIANEYLVSPDPGTVLILVGERFPRKTVAWKQLEAAVRGHAGAKPNILEYPLPREWEMHQWVATRARERGLEIDRPVAEYLLAVAGSDAMTLLNEILKIEAYLAGTGRNRISRGDIDVLVIPRNHMSEFKLIEALSLGDMAGAERVLSQLGSKTAASQLVYVVAREIRMMAEISRLMGEGKGDQAIKAALRSGGYFRGDPTDWVLRQLKKRAGGFGTERLVRSIRSLESLDLALKGGTRARHDERFLLDRFMYDMARS